MVSHLEPDIRECEVKWATGSTAVNKASGCDGIPPELFKSLKVYVVKVFHSICEQIRKTQQWPDDRDGSNRECSNHWTITLISHASKVMFKILQARLQYYVNQELPDNQTGLRKGRGTRDQIANIRWIIEKEREF